MMSNGRSDASISSPNRFASAIKNQAFARPSFSMSNRNSPAPMGNKRKSDIQSLVSVNEIQEQINAEAFQPPGEILEQIEEEKGYEASNTLIKPFRNESSETDRLFDDTNDQLNSENAKFVSNDRRNISSSPKPQSNINNDESDVQFN